jgi:immune inhibitor A
MVRADGQPWRARIQAYDSTFTTEATEALTLHYLSQPSNHASQAGVSVFNDNNQHYNPETPTAGVINPHTGTKILIGKYNVFGDYVRVSVGPSQ